MADRDTVAAGLTERIDAVGDWRAIAGNTPMVLDDPARCVVVREGQADLFLAERMEDGSLGPRHHIMSAGRGEILFGGDGGGAMALVAVGEIGTSVAMLDLATFRMWADESALGPSVAARLDRWVAGLSDALSRRIASPPIDATLAPGGERALASDQRVAGAEGIVWIAPTELAPTFLDLGTYPCADVAVPLSRTTWIAYPGPTTATGTGTEGMLAEGRLWPALARFNRTFLTLLPLALGRVASEEADRLRARSEADVGAAGRAIGQLASTLTAQEGAVARANAGEAADPVRRAVAAVLAAQGAAPGEATYASGAAPTIDDVARDSGLRIRPIKLGARWWRRDVGAFLVLGGEERRPFAVLPRGQRGRYDLYDPVAQTLTPLDPPHAPVPAGQAFMLYAPLPARPLKGLDIGGGAIRWSRSDVVAIVVLGLIASVLGLAVPVAISFVVDTIIPSFDASKLVETGLMLVLLGITIFALRFGAQIAAVRVEGRSGSRLQAGVLDRVLRLPAGFFRGHVAGDLAKRVMAIQTIERAINGTMISSLLSGLFALISLGLMAYYSMALALIAFGYFALVAGLIVALGILRVRRERDVIATAGKAAGTLLQLAVSIAKLRLAAAEDRAFLQWTQHQSRFVREQYAAGRIDKLGKLLAAISLPLGTAGLFFLIHWLGLTEADNAKALQLGQILAFITAFSQGLGGIAGLASTVVQLAALRPLYAYAAPILEAVPEVTAGKVNPGTLSGSIEFSRISFRYEEDAPLIFNELSLSIAPGEFVAIVGPSGTGKSTLLRLLLGFDHPQSGAILLDGRSLESLDVERVRRQMGVVMQGGRLFPGTLLHNIFGGRLTLPSEAAWAAAEKVGLADEIRAMPMEMETVISDSGGALSGGQVQRVLLARAIIASPSILLLDEATSALDNRTQATVTGNLDRLKVTRIIIAHRLSTVVNADRIIVLNEGRVHESGRYDELIARGGLFHDLAMRQLV